MNQRECILGWKGVKIMGDLQSKKMKIFFVGDSFTSPYLGKSEMYYDVINKNIDIELFVYGGGGYGTLQEYLVINKYVDEIKPDLIILQACSNDFINNDWNLEKRSFVHNNYTIRPYYEKGTIVYRFPRGPFFREFITYSRLAYFLIRRYDIILARLNNIGYLNTVEKYIGAEGLNFIEFKRSVDTTSELIGMIKKRCGKIPIVAFSVFEDEPYFSQFKDIFRKHNINFLENIPELAWAREDRKWRKNNEHWTKKGHAACGEYLTEYIKINFLINR